MDPARTELVAEWVGKSWRDLGAAKLLATREEFRDQALYHCQQAAEKALKGLLVSWGIPFPKTHNIASLLHLAAGPEPVLLGWEEEADRLTRYAVTTRYPNLEGSGADAEEVEEALNSAEMLLRQALMYLPPACRPTDCPPGGGQGQEASPDQP